jgi:dienelactone hydrolase
MHRRRVPLPLVVVAGAGALLLSGCRASLQLAESDHPRVLAHQVLEGPPPSAPGPHSVGFLTYGSGTDRQRPEYAEEVAFTTGTVDASLMVDRTDMVRFWRRYWGFDSDAFPLNGRVWFPEGGGPFPLVLIVHGNHNPRDFSDPGYAYLGELLASRGFILASVDMNFLNGSIRGENDARGWMLLKHLQAWKGFHADPDNPFHGMVDWDRIALIGHSRGGEAVGHAAAFNRLTHYPDDASLTFDFGFNIRSLVAIAPVDGQYEPADRPVPLQDVNYLVFHGSHDGDVTSFAGLRQYSRVRFTGEVPAFKSAVYVYRANHGQWNSGWGAFDNGPRSPRILALDGLMPEEDQREFGRLYISAFLEATLLGEERWLPLFRDHRTAGGWLPPTMYQTRFQHASFRPLANYDEDIDLTTGTEPGVMLRGEGLSTWREGELVLRSRITQQRQVPQQQYGAWLGWHRTKDEAPPHYAIRLPQELARRWDVGEGTTLDFLLAPTTRRPPPPSKDEVPGEGEEGEHPGNPKEGPGPEARAGGEEAEEAVEPAGEGDPLEEDDTPLDLTIRVADAGGEEAALPLSHFGPIRRPLEVRVLRRRDLERSRFPTLHEVVGHGFSVPLDEFLAVNPALELATLQEIRLVFDRTRVGEVIVAELGLSRPGSGFLQPRVAAGEAISGTEGSPHGVPDPR